ncbi:unnamed protein product [Rotaria socialis]|uniref:Uncharacterized protein n=1 Tax=Rotaria socialis TaxID=392032 RepID=A0A818MZ24_9BILA|nr:unnamed protein product [Rotaria socialis]CAF3404830.1 unnamed protein product [Rotaria socialis]CAF3596134.1 unnamed protein product [Rotaria socialis]CAF4255946.1 unnamed protein product [Rotaria socialis]CAF4412808.1 unnamed protein product [Rotaria socialis]
MTCQHPGCSFGIFSSCINHCMQNVCLEHLIEHGDIFISDFTGLLNRLDKSTCIVMKETNIAAKQIVQRREYEIERINRMYDEEQKGIRKRLAFAETANTFLKDKQDKLIICKQKNECHLSQHDIEQLKLYATVIRNPPEEKQAKEEKTIINVDTLNESNTMRKNFLGTYSCPLFRPNVFGITIEHKIRFNCDGSSFLKCHLASHFENYHRMLPEYAQRLKNAIVNGQLPDEVKLFSDDEIIFNKEYLIDCPLTDGTNVFGAQSSLSKLMHLPCTKKQLLLTSMLNHFHCYHRMKYSVAKTIYTAMKTKSLTSDSVLFEPNERIAKNLSKKR